jgi:preprotein translocase subunit SecG
MRLIGLVLALGAIVWVMLQAAGGGDGETVISKGHQEALIKAQGVEQTLQKSMDERMQTLEEE